jgi:hypothetical protein
MRLLNTAVFILRHLFIGGLAVTFYRKIVFCPTFLLSLHKRKIKWKGRKAKNALYACRRNPTPPLASSASCFIPAVVMISNKIIIYLEQKYWDWEDLLDPPHHAGGYRILSREPTGRLNNPPSVARSKLGNRL